MAKFKVLLVDDEPAIRFGIREFLGTSGYEVEEADSCGAAARAFAAAPPDVAILDYKLPDGTALDLLPRLKAIDSDVPVALLTGHGSIDLAVRAVKEGAEQFLTKPVELPALLVVVQRMIENRRMRQQQHAGAIRLAREAVDPFVGTSPAIRTLAGEARKVVQSESPVLIHGETGAGKGVLARWLHANGPRAAEPFVDLNCAGLARELLESELFGHEKGAFTGAVARKPGLLETANRGTVFLDEIGDMDLLIQPKLLTVLEEKRFRRLGSVSDRHVDVHLVSATHQDLGRLVREERFRSDLYYRISTIPLTVPALRDRAEDIAPLAQRLLARIAADMGCASLALTADAVVALRTYKWPGNIRELRNVLERAVLLGNRVEVTAADLRLPGAGPAPAAAGTAAGETPTTLLELETWHIERVLREEGGNVTRAAARLGIPKSTLYQKLKRQRRQA